MLEVPASESLRVPADRRRDVVVQSVGRATPALAAAVAKGLGLPVETVVRAVYRAPAVLVPQVEPALAEHLVQVLCATGLDVSVAQAGQAAQDVPLLDVAAHLADPARLDEAAQALAQFTGMTAAAASALITTPPGVILGGVSQASIDALRACLPSDVLELTVVAPQDSGYALILLPCADAVARSVLDDLARREVPLLARQGLVAVDLDHAQAQQLWQRHSRSAAVRLLHTSFMRYAISLHAADDGSTGPFAPLQADLLHRLAGVPHDLMDTLAQALPVVLLDDVPHARIASVLAELAGAGLRAQADLSSFRRYRLHWLGGGDLPALHELLRAEDLWQAGDAPAAPAGGSGLTLPAVLSRPRARALQARMRALGAEVDMQELPHG